MELVSIGKFAKMVGVTPTTLRRMHQSGDFIPHHVSKGGTRYYSMEQLKEFSNAPENTQLAVGYCRVATPEQKNELQTQVENVKSYMCARGYKFEIITDVGSGINYKKKGLRELVNKINNQKVSTVVLLYKDRLLSFGFELLEYLCEINGVSIEIIDNSEQSKEQELTDDLLQSITFFANALYGPSSKKTKKIVDAVRKNATSSD
ncbi:MAG: IS607 family transposase [Desulfovibrionaceae bacterium]|nr:IS607 family transposase [Desulfovibrionaceae bacterium]